MQLQKMWIPAFSSRWKIGGALCATCGHIIDHHDSTSCTTLLANPNNSQLYIVKLTNPRFHFTYPLCCTTHPSLFCTPTAPWHIPIIHGVTHQEVRFGTPTNQNNNDLHKEFLCAIKKGNTPRRSLKGTSKVNRQTLGWTKNTQKPNFFEKRKKSSKTQKLKNV